MTNANSADLPSEEEIVGRWRDRDNIAVSVLCPAFNHEDYIADALSGFLRQESSVAFEILVHDDASIDGTPEIIRAYQERYPKIIRAVIQTENQFSRGGFRPAFFLASKAYGRYVAICEGDDHWEDTSKLQRQFDCLEAHPAVNFCVHNARCIDGSGADSSYRFPEREAAEKILDYRDVFTCSGQFAPTSSFFLRRDCMLGAPDFVYEAPVGDFFIEVFAGSGGIYYLPHAMSVYRRGVPGAWSSTTTTDIDKSIAFNLSMLKSLQALEQYLPVEERALVACKKHNVYDNLCLRTAARGELIPALRYWASGLNGSPGPRKSFASLLRLMSRWLRASSG